MHYPQILPLVLLGLGICSCKEKLRPKDGVAETPIDKAAVISNETLHATRYDKTYQGELAESVMRMVGAENNQEFMKYYREFSEKYPNFWEINGNLRLILVGLKGRIDEGKPLTPVEKQAARDLTELLLKAKQLPSSEPYQDAKVRIASAYADVDVSIAPKLVENYLDEAIAKLPLAEKRETEVPK